MIYVLPYMKFPYAVKDRSGNKLTDFEDNELIRFVKFNKSGIGNLIVYLFWIVVAVFFQDHEELINFSKEFMDEVKREAHAQYKSIYFGYLIRINRNIMDAISEILPFFLTRSVKYCLALKLKGHDLPLDSDKTYCLIFSVIFTELFGHKMTDDAILRGRAKYIHIGKKALFEHSASIKKMNLHGIQLQKSTSAHSQVKARRDEINIFKHPPLKEKRYKVDYEEAKDQIAANHGSMRTLETKLKQEIGAKEIKADLLDEMLDIFGKIKDCPKDFPRDETKQLISEKVNKMSLKYHPVERLESLNAEIEAAYRKIPQNNRVQGSMLSLKKVMTKSKFSATQRNLKSNQLIGLKGVGLEQIDEEKQNQKNNFRRCTAASHKPPLNSNKSPKHKAKITIEAPDGSKKNMLQNQDSFQDNDSAAPSNYLRDSRKRRQNSSDLASKQSVTVLKGIMKSLEPKEEKLWKENPVYEKLEINVDKALESSRKSQDYDHIKRVGSKWRANDSQLFDLQFMSPMLQKELPDQIAKIHHPDRKQKNLLCIHETSCLEKENEFEAKMEQFVKDSENLKVRKQKQAQIDAQNTQLEAQKALMTKQISATKQYEYQREAIALKQLVKTGKNSTYTLFQKEQEQEIKTISKKLNRQEQGYPKMLAMTHVFNAPRPSKDHYNSTTALPSTAFSQTTIDKFKSKPVQTINQVRNLRHNIQEEKFNLPSGTKQIMDEEAKRKEYKDKTLDLRQNPYFFYDQDYLRVQLDHEKLSDQTSSKVSPQQQQQQKSESAKGEVAQQNTLHSLQVTQQSSSQMSTKRGRTHSMRNLEPRNDLKNLVPNLKLPGMMASNGKKSGQSMRVQSSKYPQTAQHQNIVQKIHFGEQSSRTRPQSSSMPVHQRPSHLHSLPRQNSESQLPQKKKPLHRNLSHMDFQTGRLSKEEKEIILDAPFSQRDLGKAYTRKTSKILRECKTKEGTAKDAPPLHEQYLDYVRNFQENAAKDHKDRLQETLVRKRLDDTFAKSFKRSSNPFSKKIEAQDTLYDKHTYSTMRKVSSHKSRKIFVFDSFTAKQIQEYKEIEAEEVDQPTDFFNVKDVQYDKAIQKKAEQGGKKEHHIFRGRNYEDRESEKDADDDGSPESQKKNMLQNKKPYVKEPKPYYEGKRASTIMLHTMTHNQSTAATTRDSAPASSIKIDILGKKLQNQKNSGLFQSQIGFRNSNQGGGIDKQKSMSSRPSILVTLSNESPTISPTNRRQNTKSSIIEMQESATEYTMWEKQIDQLNEKDQKAEELEGIHNIKGKVMVANGGLHTRDLKMVPHEEKTKAQKLLGQIRIEMEQDQEYQEQLRLKKERQIVDIDLTSSSEEDEKFVVGKDRHLKTTEQQQQPTENLQQIADEPKLPRFKIQTVKKRGQNSSSTTLALQKQLQYSSTQEHLTERDSKYSSNQFQLGRFSGQIESGRTTQASTKASLKQPNDYSSQRKSGTKKKSIEIKRRNSHIKIPKLQSLEVGQKDFSHPFGCI